MKNLTIILLLFILNIGCGEKTEKVINQKTDNKNLDVIINNSEEQSTMSSADYSNLLSTYNCDVTSSELAKILTVNEADITHKDQPNQNKCYYFLNGFGENSAGDNTQLFWGLYPSSKAQNKKEIKNYLKNQEELPESARMGMTIELAETKDCYIAQQPAHARVIIYNENYDNAFILNYGALREYKTRTKEQQAALKEKMTYLANYLLKKHKN